jgi:hyperosmotically inducible protein
MKHRLLALAISLAILTAVAVNQNAAAQADARSQERIAREVRHELLMLPWFGVFDYIAFKVDGGTVTLMGQVVRPSLKSDAENAVKRIEGVERVENKIEVLPPSSMDDGLRLALYRAIYGYPPLEKYALGVQKPIRIIVKERSGYLGGRRGQRSRQEPGNPSRQQRPRNLFGDQ